MLKTALTKGFFRYPHGKAKHNLPGKPPKQATRYQCSLCDYGSNFSANDFWLSQLQLENKIYQADLCKQSFSSAPFVHMPRGGRQI
ncbi:hypothetical protein JTE90_012560 [Oedothorax gibbosus]|uniref:Uncharacterized protein n=1 Tax=Oedothorax gibbosus TaxID=931172 RepID=A0AAV6TXG6_9ARAC|nr:hypothetical protein JTE90_012560 [Oedothorax gibbosus]